MNVQDLIAKRARAWEAAKAFLEAHRGENGFFLPQMEKPMTAWKRRSRILRRRSIV
jgi:hypothetical protein